MTERFADPAHRYLLDERIATGGMGEVWRASDTVLGRTVAVKLLKPEYADDPAFRSRFQTEARHAAALHHPNVAAVFDFGEDEGHRPYLVMELVVGKPLSALLVPGRQMPPDQARFLLGQAADALAAAHEAGIVHRDVKPGNLLVTPDRTVKITDFGIARAAAGLALTRTGEVMGTPQYLSPEQAEGGKATAASDVYSLGVVLFECLAGRRPYIADSPVATALAHIREPVPDLPDNVPGDLAAVTRRALAKEPRERFPDAAAFAAALRHPSSVPPLVPPVVADPTAADRTAVLTGLPPARADEPGPPEDGEEKQRRRLSPWLLLVPIVLLAALVAWALWAGLDDEDPATTSDEPTTSEPTSEAPTSEPATSQPPTTQAPDNSVEVDPADYVGRFVDDVVQDLEDLGLRVSRNEVANPGDETEGEVFEVNPSGTLEEGDRVTVSFWGPPPEPEPEPPVDTPTLTPDDGGPGEGNGNGNGNGSGQG